MGKLVSYIKGRANTRMLQEYLHLWERGNWRLEKRTYDEIHYLHSLPYIVIIIIIINTH
jgi:hypothetical protein